MALVQCHWDASLDQTQQPIVVVSNHLLTSRAGGGTSLFAGRESQLGVLIRVFVFVPQGYARYSVLRMATQVFFRCYLPHREVSAMASL